MATATEKVAGMIPDTVDGGIDLEEMIDRKYAQFLGLLDQFQKAREALVKQLSSGYMSIAAANFSSQSRIRYGQDHYDERMRALRRVAIDGNKENPRVSIIKKDPLGKNLTFSEVDSPADEADLIDGEEKTDADEITDKSGSVKVPVDPIRWFGLFVPTALKAAQSSFSAAVDDHISVLVNLDKAMKEVEIEILRARKRLLKQSKTKITRD